MRIPTIGKLVARRCCFLALPVVMTVSAWGTTITLSGQARQVSMPANLQAGIFESDAGASIILESQNVTLTSLLPVDVLSPGFYSTTAGLTPGSIDAGTLVSSILLHSDPVQWTGTRFQGSITVDSNILGVMVLSPTLNQSDGVLGLPGVSYANTILSRGLELDGQDLFALSEDRRTLTFDVYTVQMIDELRIVTAGTGTGSGGLGDQATPEPGSMALLPLGLATVAFFRRSTFCK